ncbi:hypothetical protein KAR91_79140 [Candidatus Pacearchaeota archaeon]|nr:hypothetical protein [Candidatus Pacearchaeota archaeon]
MATKFTKFIKEGFNIFSKKEVGTAIVQIPNRQLEQSLEMTRQDNLIYYLSMYEDVPLVNAIITTQTDQVIQNYYFEGPNSDKLQKWADKINLTSFLYDMEKNKFIFGDAFAELVINNSEIKKMKVLNPIWMHTYRSEVGLITGYGQVIDNKEMVLWGTTGDSQQDQKFNKRIEKFDNIVHFKHDAIVGQKYGVSMLKSIAPSVRSKVWMEDNLGKLLDKYVAPLIHATVGSDEMPAQDDVVTDIASTLRNLHAESEIATSHLVKLEVLDFNSKGIDIKTPLNHIEQQVITGGQVPPILLGRGDGVDKAAEVQLRNFGRHIKSLQRGLKVEVEDLIVIKHDLGTPEDQLVWGNVDERETEMDIDVLRGLVTDGIVTPQKANDLLPPRFRETLPEPVDPLNGQSLNQNGTQIPRDSQGSSDKVRDNPNNPQKTTKNKNASGRVNKSDRRASIDGNKK